MQTSNLSASTGRAADPHDPDARRSGDDAGQAEALKPADTASAASAAAVAADDADVRPTPPQTLREFEHALRGLGYSARKATAIARNGFKASAPEPDEGIELHELRAALERRGAALKGLSP